MNSVKTLLVVILLSALTLVLQGQIRVAVDDIIIENPAKNKSDFYYKIPEIITFSFIEESNVKLEKNSFVRDQTLKDSSRLKLINNELKEADRSAIDYTIRGSIRYVGEQMVLDFTVNDSRLERIRKNSNGQLGIFTELSGKIREKIREMKIEKASHIRIAFIADHSPKKSKQLSKFFVSDVIQNFIASAPLIENVVIVPWEYTRSLSFKADSINLLNEVSADAIIRTIFETDNDGKIIINPTLEIKSLNLPVEFPPIAIGVQDGDLVSPLQNLYSEVVAFSIINGKWNKKNLDIIIEHRNASYNELITLGRDYLDKNMPEMAGYFASRAINIKKKAHVGFLLMARIKLKMEQYEGSLYAFKQALDRDKEMGEDPFAYAIMGSLYQKLGNTKEAIRNLRKCHLLDDDFQSVDYNINYLLGQSYRSIENYDSALFFLEKAIRASPKDDKPKYEMGLVEFDIGNYSEAIKFLKKIQNEEDFSQLSDIIGECYYQLSRNNLKNMNYEASLTNIDSALNYKIDYYNLKQKVLINYAVNDFDEGDAIIERKIDRGHLERRFTYLLMGLELRGLFADNNEEVKLATGAIHCFKEHLKYDSLSIDAYFYLGNLYSGINQNETSVRYLEKAMAMDTNNVDYALDLAEVYIKTRRYNKVNSLLDPIITQFDILTNSRNFALKLYLSIVAARLQNNIDSQAEKELSRISSKGLVIQDWSFKSLIDWLKNQQDSENIKYAIELSENLEGKRAVLSNE
ncbi:MAG: hypothetical protein ABJG47_13950 [Ekhidna sp.]